MLQKETKYIMEKAKEEKKLDTTTEEKIKQAARKVFLQKGYAATRTRDIAEEAGINLALLNYYFRSKEKLFDLIMMETVAGFMQTMGMILNNEQSSIEDKAEAIAAHYIDFIIQDPNVPIFMLSEIRNNADSLLEKFPIRQLVSNSAFFRQYREAAEAGKVTESNPLHFLMNLLGLVIFPFIGQPMLQRIGGMTDHQYRNMMLERKKLIPIWVNAMLKVT